MANGGTIPPEDIPRWKLQRRWLDDVRAKAGQAMQSYFDGRRSKMANGGNISPTPTPTPTPTPGYEGKTYFRNALLTGPRQSDELRAGKPDFGYRPPEGNWQRAFGNWFGGVIENSLQRDAQWEAERLVAQYNDAVFRRDNGFTPEERLAASQEVDQIREKYVKLEEYMQTGASGARALGALVDTPGLYSQFDKISAGYPGKFEGELEKLPTKTEGPQLPGVPEQFGPVDVGTYPSTPSGQPFGYTASTPAQSLGLVEQITNAVSGVLTGGAEQPVTTESAAPVRAVTETIADTKVGGVPEGAYGGDILGAGTTLTPESLSAAGGFLPESAVGGQTPTINAYEGAGIPTPGGRGFETYDQLRLAMEGAGRPRDEYGRVDTGVFQPWEIQEMYEGEYSRPDSLQQFLGGARGKSYRGLINQRVDLGQGIQDYSVRRDAYGNIRSFMPARSSALHPSERLFRRY